MNSTTVMRLSLVQGPAEYINVSEDRMGDRFWGDHVSRAEISVRILALTAMCVSVSVTSYLSDSREDIQSYILALKLGLGYCEAKISQWRPVGHEWSTCCKLVTVPCLLITRRTPLIPWSKIYFLASPFFHLPSRR